MSACAIRLAAIAAVSLGLLAAVVVPSQARLDELYAKAKAEGSLVLYVGGPTAPWEERAKQFEQRYPGIKISITGGFSNVLDKQIDQQLKENKLAVDTAIFQTLDDFVRWKAEGQLLPFKPDGFDAIDASFKDSEGAFFGVMVIAMPYQYNTQLVKSEDVPRSALDFLKPIFRGKVVAAYPADDDATLYLCYTIVQKYGWEYMDKYMANRPNFIQGHLSVQRSISSGQNLVTPDSIFSITEAEKRAGKPVELILFDHGPDADLAVDRRRLQERAAPERGQTFPELAARKRSTGEGGDVVGAFRCAATDWLQADILLPRSQRL